MNGQGVIAPADPFVTYSTRGPVLQTGQPLYDRVNVPGTPTAVGNITFFTVPIGSSATLITAGAAAARNKTFRDTNIKQSGYLPDKAFLTKGFSLSYIPASVAPGAAPTNSVVQDMSLLAWGGVLTLYIGDTPYMWLPLALLPGIGIWRGGAATTAAGTTLVSGGGLGDGTPDHIYWLSPDGGYFAIDDKQTFRVEVTFDAVTLQQTYDLMLVLHGIMRRTV